MRLCYACFSNAYARRALNKCLRKRTNRKLKIFFLVLALGSAFELFGMSDIRFEASETSGLSTKISAREKGRDPFADAVLYLKITRTYLSLCTQIQ